MAGGKSETAKPLDVPRNVNMENFKKKVAGVRLFDEFEADWTKILYFTLDDKPERFGEKVDGNVQISKLSLSLL